MPIPGETGQLGTQIRSEEDFSQLYQVFTDELLGSGQFGTVYGGSENIHSKVVRFCSFVTADLAIKEFNERQANM